MRTLLLFSFFIALSQIAYAFPPETAYDKTQDVIDYVNGKDVNKFTQIIAFGECKESDCGAIAQYILDNHPKTDIAINMGDFIPFNPPDLDVAWDNYLTTMGTLLASESIILLHVRGDQEDATRYGQAFGDPDDFYFDIPIGDSYTRIVSRSNSQDANTTNLLDDSTISISSLFADSLSNNYNTVVFDYKQWACHRKLHAWELSDPPVSNCDGCKWYVDEEDEINDGGIATYKAGNVRTVFSADNNGVCNVFRGGVNFQKANVAKSPTNQIHIIQIYRDVTVSWREDFVTGLRQPGSWQAVGNANRR